MKRHHPGPLSSEEPGGLQNKPGGSSTTVPWGSGLQAAPRCTAAFHRGASRGASSSPCCRARSARREARAVPLRLEDPVLLSGRRRRGSRVPPSRRRAPRPPELRCRPRRAPPPDGNRARAAHGAGGRRGLARTESSSCEDAYHDHETVYQRLGFYVREHGVSGWPPRSSSIVSSAARIALGLMLPAWLP